MMRTCGAAGLAELARLPRPWPAGALAGRAPAVWDGIRPVAPQQPWRQPGGRRRRGLAG